VVGYRELAASGPGTFGELDTTGARSVLRRFSDAWFSAAARRKAGAAEVRFPRRKRGLMAVRWYYGTFVLDGRRVRLPMAKGRAPLWVRLDREVPYPVEQVRSVTLVCVAGRLFLEVTAEVPVAVYPEGLAPDPGRVAGVDLGVIHPFAVAGPDGAGLLVSGRALRAEHHLHLVDTKKRQRAVARRVPSRGQRGSRRWGKTRRRQRQVEARHGRRVRQAQHEAAKGAVAWAVEHRVGTLVVGDPRGVLDLQAGRRHNRRVRTWRVGAWIRILTDKAERAGVGVRLVDERGTSSTCPDCHRRVPKRPVGSFLARTAGSAGTATWSVPATSPGDPAAPRSAPVYRRWGRSRTVEQADTFLVSVLPGVTPDGTTPVAARGRLAGRGPPPPGGVARLTARIDEHQGHLDNVHRHGTNMPFWRR
jgi:putative transposase